MAGVLPGLLLGLTLAILCLFIATQAQLPQGRGDPAAAGAAHRRRRAVGPDDAWSSSWAASCRGVFTATESASIAVLWAFFVTMFIYRDYKWSDLPKLVHRTVKTVTIVMILIGFAASFGYLMTLMQIPLKVTALLHRALGQPLRDPAADQRAAAGAGHADGHGAADPDPARPSCCRWSSKLGVDPVHFGMIMMVNLGIGLITPPVGTVLFVGSAVGKLKIEAVVPRDVCPSSAPCCWCWCW